MNALIVVNGKEVVTRMERTALTADWQESTVKGVRGKVWRWVAPESWGLKPSELTGRESFEVLSGSFSEFCNSYQRIPAILRLESDPAEPLKWFRLLGEEWTDCDNVGQYKDEILERLRDATRAQLDAMMNEEEQAAWADLPDEITAFRGCSAINQDGMSFSLSRDIAANFLSLHRYETEEPLLVEAKIPKRFSVLKLVRSEQEIISTAKGAAVVVSITHLPKSIALNPINE